MTAVRFDPQGGNGPAFPQADGHHGRGMTLRDWFAGQALVGALANPAHDFLAAAEVASDAYLHADAMLAERAKAPTP